MTRTIRKSVGIIGLGIIGRRIADHLRHQGLSVFVWNRTPRPVPNFVGSPGRAGADVQLSPDLRLRRRCADADDPGHFDVAYASPYCDCASDGLT